MIETFFSFFFFFFWVESRLGLLLCSCLSSYYSLTTDPGRALDIKLAPIAPIAELHSETSVLISSKEATGWREVACAFHSGGGGSSGRRGVAGLVFIPSIASS